MTEEIEKVKAKIAEEVKPIKKVYREFSADDFVESHTAKEFLANQTAKYKQAAYDSIPNIIAMLKSTMSVDDVLDLDVREYTSLIQAYSARMGIKAQKVDFLEKK